jgi:hypothetical protein
VPTRGLAAAVLKGCADDARKCRRGQAPAYGLVQSISLPLE